MSGFVAAPGFRRSFSKPVRSRRSQSSWAVLTSVFPCLSTNASWVLVRLLIRRAAELLAWHDDLALLLPLADSLGLLPAGLHAFINYFHNLIEFNFLRIGKAVPDLLPCRSIARDS